MILFKQVNKEEILRVDEKMDIFKILDEKFKLEEKIKNLSLLLLDTRYFFYNCRSFSFEAIFDGLYFKLWKYSNGCISLKEFKEVIGIRNTEDPFVREYYFPENTVAAIKFLQYAYNATYYVKKMIANDSHRYLGEEVDNFFKSFDNSFNYIISKIGQEVIKNPSEDYYILVPKNNKTEKCAQVQDKTEVAFLLYDFISELHVGDYKKKREILKLLANEIEPKIEVFLKAHPSGPVHDIFKNLSSCFNNFNIRHNNSDPKKKNYYHKELDAFTEKDYEEIYDVTYDLILDAILLDEYQNSTVKRYESCMDKAGLRRS